MLLGYVGPAYVHRSDSLLRGSLFPTGGRFRVSHLAMLHASAHLRRLALRLAVDHVSFRRSQVRVGRRSWTLRSQCPVTRLASPSGTTLRYLQVSLTGLTEPWTSAGLRHQVCTCPTAVTVESFGAKISSVRHPLSPATPAECTFCSRGEPLQLPVHHVLRPIN